MRKAFAYVRVSTEEQASEGVSLAAQEAKVRAYCTLKGLDLVEVVIDAGVSAGKPLGSRAGGARLAAAVRSRAVEVVVAVRLDRLFRDAADCLQVTRAWEAKGAALHVIDLGGNSIDTTSAAGRFMLTVLAGAAEMERNLVRERTRDALAHKRSRGEVTNHTPFGFVREGDALTVDSVEAAVAGRIRAMRAGGQTYREIAATLNANGVPAKHGGAWVHTAVRKVAMREEHARAAA